MNFISWLNEKTIINAMLAMGIYIVWCITCFTDKGNDDDGIGFYIQFPPWDAIGLGLTVLVGIVMAIFVFI